VREMEGAGGSRRPRRFFLQVFPFIVPTLALAGLLRFSTSFFLARRSLPTTSSCGHGEASKLLVDVLGLSLDEVKHLVDEGLLVGNDDDFSRASGADASVASNGDDVGGCWTPRTVDAAVVVVVDALRFDFAAGRLPKSIGSRLQRVPTSSSSSSFSSSSRSQLFTFVADPPTVTMQRLKGLTTGGLPTFADISGNFGGANIDEDSWVQQLRDVPVERRRRRQDRHDASTSTSASTSNGGEGLGEQQQQNRGARLAFVGDDTWIDLFPVQFDDAHPYPSFNTRDLDTVDDGCMKHLPRLLQNLGGDGDNDKRFDDGEKFELVVAHFLGVDHVGHTYGPNDRHMTEKLGQIDDALSYVLDRIDSTPDHFCRAAFVFGDHGMSEEGNHGGGTEDEINAALFVHYSQGCGSVGNDDTQVTSNTSGAAVVVTSLETDSDELKEAFGSIHQIDLVPTISTMLGLPIPYANLGGLVPALLPPPRQVSRRRNMAADNDYLLATKAATIALALNAAQVWNYLDTYSKTANPLPAQSMSELRDILDKGTDTYRSALLSSFQGKEHFGNENNDQFGEKGSRAAYQKASVLYKLFLSEATELGKRVWTRFDTDGMILGGIALGLALLTACPLWDVGFWSSTVKAQECLAQLSSGFGFQPAREAIASSLDASHIAESAVALLFMIFHCLALTFSNSYIEAEKDIIVSLLAVLCVLIAMRLWNPSCRDGRASVLLRSESTKGHSPADGRSTSEGKKTITWRTPVLVALCSRVNGLFVTGHGLDPSIRMYVAHNSAVFLTSLSVLIGMRLWMAYIRCGSLAGQGLGRCSPFSGLEASVDVACLILLAFSWWEKRLPDHSRNGYQTCRVALLLSLLGVVISIFAPPTSSAEEVFKRPKNSSIHINISRAGGKDEASTQHRRTISFLPSLAQYHHISSLLFKAMIFTTATMGPSAASSSVLFFLQAWALCRMTGAPGPQRSSAPVLACLWRLSIRHAFFATNHAPTFSRLQYSAAFVASDVFYFHTAGLLLFINTFGWEIMGTLLVLAATSHCRKANIWAWFCFYQLLEAAGSCLSVSLMRRHLMVWAIFAPRFVFAGAFTLICLSFWFLGLLL